MTTTTEHPYAGQCFCYPSKPHGECEHCNRARQWVQQDVYCDQTSLVELCMAQNEADWLDHCSNLWGHHEIGHLEGDEVETFQCNLCGMEFDTEEEVEDAATDTCDDHPQEVFQWFAVSPWLAEKLTEIGAPVLGNEHGQWWGRTCCGQGIEMDGILQAISRTL